MENRYLRGLGVLRRIDNATQTDGDRLRVPVQQDDKSRHGVRAPLSLNTTATTTIARRQRNVVMIRRTRNYPVGGGGGGGGGGIGRTP